MDNLEQSSFNHKDIKWKHSVIWDNDNIFSNNLYDNTKKSQRSFKDCFKDCFKCHRKGHRKKKDPFEVL